MAIKRAVKTYFIKIERTALHKNKPSAVRIKVQKKGNKIRGDQLMYIDVSILLHSYRSSY